MAGVGGAIAEAAAGLAGGIFSGATDLWSTWHNIGTSQRDFDYQVALQNLIFQREDNAVQRRKADLIAAGLNPNLAAGSAAGAGAVVGRSNTPQLHISGNPVGTALDMASAVSQLRAQREQNQILKNQKDESAAKAQIAQNEAVLNNINFNTMLGLKSYLHDYGEGRFGVAHSGFNDNKQLTNENSPIMDYLKWEWQNNKNSADLLQRDVDFYTADKIMDYFGAGISAFSGIGSGLNSFGRFNKFYRR